MNQDTNLSEKLCFGLVVLSDPRKGKRKLLVGFFLQNTHKYIPLESFT